ncbi:MULTISPECIES: chemotaxis protein CheW [unclassified Chamaesiphon]|uniref:chemotaxis protein CheW n=1 Tax=unclassified Chamaesiphon TaxID=2620921 RepID=UPI00286BEF39|nr:MULTISPECIES: chemotaxis protein CheW [unclassified Chamaesiphon]
MAIYSPLRSRRLAAQQVEVTQRLITFELRAQTFALPLDRVHKVIALNALGDRVKSRLYGDSNQTGVSLTTYQGQELVVIDIGQRIFGSTQTLLPTSSHLGADATAPAVRYLAIVEPEPDRLVGVPLDSPPIIQSMPLSAFKPLPAIYQQHSKIHCVSAMSIDLPDRPSIFLLDVVTLAAPA